jgi:hypothetical protein
LRIEQADKEGREEERWVVTSPIGKSGSSYHIVQLTKHEHRKSVYLYPPNQTPANCINLTMLKLARLQILARLNLARLPITPHITPFFIALGMNNCLPGG